MGKVRLLAAQYRLHQVRQVLGVGLGQGRGSGLNSSYPLLSNLSSATNHSYNGHYNGHSKVVMCQQLHIIWE
jgi:hypothetical protein